MHEQITAAPTIAEPSAATYIGFSPAFLRQARSKGCGPAYIRIGRTIRYRIADLDDWLAGHRVVTRDQGAREIAALSR